MKKSWNKPMCTTVIAQDLSTYIKAAAWSGESMCMYGVFR